MLVETAKCKKEFKKENLKNGEDRKRCLLFGDHTEMELFM